VSSCRTGKLKETEGKVTGDRSREAEGKADQAKGHAKDAAHSTKESVRHATR
jgi:uncharacterized protein YjbJ (UPF0337 family)